MPGHEPEHLETVVIGAGQAGLAVGHHLARRGRQFLILDASRRVGDAWRNRWDSLRLFTPARYNGLAGMPFPAPAHTFPTKDQVADYLEAYATRFRLPVRTGVRVDRLSRGDGGFVVAAGDRRWEADNAVVAMSTFQVPRVPAFAADLGPDVVQFHAAGYRNPSQLQNGGVLVVGAGNSGAEIALEVAGRHPTWLAGKESGHVPFRIEGAPARYVFQPLLFRVIGHRVLTVDTPIGRKLRPRLMSHGAPLVRVKPKDLAAAGVRRAPRVVGRVTATPCWPTNRSWRWPTSSGAPGSVPTSPGSTSRSSVRTSTSRGTTVGSSPPSRACTSWACRSCTPCRRDSFPASTETPSTSCRRS
jgi:putative flavoprotein involved in K+ transport